MRQADAEHTGVIAPPPVIYGSALLLVLLLQWLVPMRLIGEAQAAMSWAGWILAMLGLLLDGWGALTLRRGKTAIHPSHSATYLITGGPFRWSRNPLYVGLGLIFVGLALLLNTLWGLLMLPPVLVIMHHGVVLQEERHLEARFGEAFRRYRQRVRRYL